jgi:hypothetical protein
MTPKSLVLTDTAMLLLQTYVELDDDHWDVYESLTRDDTDHRQNWAQWETTHHNAALTHQVLWRLMHELWLLWTFGDGVPLVRHLSWHFAFDRALMKMAEATFISPHQYPRRNIRFLTHRPIETKWFVESLETAYKKALVTRDLNF